MGPQSAGPLRFAMVTDTQASPARDRTAKGLYHARFGPAPYAFDTAGVQIIGFDPTQAVLESVQVPGARTEDRSEK